MQIKIPKASFDWSSCVMQGIEETEDFDESEDYEDYVDAWDDV